MRKELLFKSRRFPPPLDKAVSTYADSEDNLWFRHKARRFVQARKQVVTAYSKLTEFRTKTLPIYEDRARQFGSARRTDFQTRKRYF